MKVQLVPPADPKDVVMVLVEQREAAIRETIVMTATKQITMREGRLLRAKTMEACGQ